MDLKAFGIRECYVKMTPLIMKNMSYSLFDISKQTESSRIKYDRKCKMESKNIQNNVLNENAMPNVELICDDPNILYVCPSCKMNFHDDYSLTAHETECPSSLRATMPDQLSGIDFCNQVGLVLKNENPSPLKQIDNQVFISKKWKKMSIPFSTKRGFKLALEKGKKIKAANYHKWCATHSENNNKTRSVKGWTNAKTIKGKLADNEYFHIYSFNKAEKCDRNTEIVTGIKKFNWWKLNYCRPLYIPLKKLTEQEIKKSTSKITTNINHKKLSISLKKLTDQDIKKWKSFVDRKKLTISLKRLTDQEIKKWRFFVEPKCFEKANDHKLTGNMDLFQDKLLNITIPLRLFTDANGVKYFS